MDQTFSFWHGTIKQFIETECDKFIEILCQGHIKHCNQPASKSQVVAWINCHRVLKESLTEIPHSFGLIFEYLLPRERGRRPDVILLTPNSVFVIEFKDFKRIKFAHLDQVEAYARDLKDYQSYCHDKNVVPILVLTEAKGLSEARERIASDFLATTYIQSPDVLAERLISLTSCEQIVPCDFDSFLNGNYGPLPSIINAAKMLFQREPLPQIRKAQSAGIPQTLDFLHKLENRIFSEQQKILALVTGVPGSGKTLVGLQFVYDNPDEGNNNRSVFLSGNAPLVKVLQYTLQNRVFVQDVHGFLKTYAGSSKRIPNERVWIYDEAQRAWDGERAKEKRGPNANSEPCDFINLGDQIADGVMIIGLIGEGQEIHIGEEAGVVQWNEAVSQSSNGWIVACPEHIASLFSSAKEVISDNRLNLDHSLRTHRASDLQDWVNFTIEGKFEEAKSLYEKLRADGYPIYLTRSLDSAKLHAIEKNSGFIDKRYGLICSSKAKNLEKHGIPNGFNATQAVKVGPWYSDDPSSELSCCQLLSVATEFSCQGLELDLPIVAWGDDLKWDERIGKWSSADKRSKAVDPHKLRLNSYRVLLTRGRDGMVVFVPEESTMDSTAEALAKAGCLQFEH